MLDDERPSFGDLLRRARHAAGLTQEGLAERAGLSVRGISDLERGVRRAPRRDTLEFLADALRLSENDRQEWDRVRRDARVSSTSIAVRPLQPTTLIGREREFELLCDALERGIAGAGQVILASGNPGVGKTRLAESLAAYGRTRDVWVLWGSCHEGEGAPAFWPWIQVIRAMVDALAADVLQRDLGRGASLIASLVPEIGEKLPGMPPLHDVESEQARFQLFDSLARFVRSASLRTPLLFVLDDLHWADRSSLELLAFLGRHIEPSRIAILGTYRANELDIAPQLGWAVAELSRILYFQHLSLGGLSQEEVSQLIEQVLGQPASEPIVAAIYARTEGNPFFVSELTRLLLASDSISGAGGRDAALTAIPPGVKGVLEQRFRSLGASDYEMLAAASVAGREFNLSLLRAVTGHSRQTLLAALDEALRAHLIERLSGSVGRYRFSHALIREALYESLPSAERVALHHRIGEFIEHAYASEIPSHLAILAHHFFEAIPGFGAEKAIDYSMRAGDHAVSQYAYSEAVIHYGQALEALDLNPLTDSAKQVEILLRLGDASSQAGQYQAAQDAFARAAEISEALGRPEHLARAAIGAAGLGVIEHSETRHLQLLEDAVAALSGEECVLRAQALARLAITLQGPATLERRWDLARQAEMIARNLGDRVALLNALLARHRSLWAPAYRDRRLDLAGELDSLLDELGGQVAVTVFPYRIYDHLEVGEIAAVDALIDAFAAQVDELHQPQRTWIATNLRIMRALLDGRFDEARQLNDQNRAVGEPAAPALAEADHVMFELFLSRELGRVDEVADSVQQIYSSNPDDPFWQALLLTSSSNRERQQRVSTDEVLASVECNHSRDGTALVAGVLLAMDSAITSNRNYAARLYAALAPHAEFNAILPSSRTLLCLGSISYPLGLLAEALGQQDTAMQHFKEALAMNERTGARAFAAHTRFAWGRTLLQSGSSCDDQFARELLRQSAQAASDLDMTDLGRQVAGCAERHFGG